MIGAHTVAQVRAAEAQLLAQLPDGVLMQRAATGLAHAVLDFVGGAYGRHAVLLVGPGDNGGDALYAGAQLALLAALGHTAVEVVRVPALAELMERAHRERGASLEPKVSSP